MSTRDAQLERRASGAGVPAVRRSLGHLRTSAMTGELGFDYVVRGTTAEVTLKGELDMAAAFKLEPTIERMVSQNSVDELVLDLGGVDFIDSGGLGSLLSIHERLSDLGVTFKIRQPSEAVKRVLDASGTLDVLIT